MTEPTAYDAALQLSRGPRLRVGALGLAWYASDHPIGRSLMGAGPRPCR